MKDPRGEEFMRAEAREMVQMALDADRVAIDRIREAVDVLEASR